MHSKKVSRLSVDSSTKQNLPKDIINLLQQSLGTDPPEQLAVRIAEDLGTKAPAPNSAKFGVAKPRLRQSSEAVLYPCKPSLWKR